MCHVILLLFLTYSGHHTNLPDASLLKSIFMNDPKQTITELSNRKYEKAVEMLAELGVFKNK